MLIVEVKTGAKDTVTHNMQVTVQGELYRRNPGMNTPGLVRMNEKDESGNEYHWYKLNGEEIIGLTTCLAQLITFPYTDPHPAKRGTAIHKYIAHLDENPKWDWRLFILHEMPEHQDREFVCDCILSYIKFKSDNDLHGTDVYNEVPLASKTLGAATLDKIFDTPGPLKLMLLYLGKKYSVVEIKKREQELMLAYFKATRIMYQLTDGKYTPPDMHKKMMIDLEKICNGPRVKFHLDKYIGKNRR